MTKQLHYVTVRPADATHAEARQEFECRGDVTSPCHQYPDCGCEVWAEGHVHPYVPHEDCWMQGWFENEGGSSYDGEGGSANNDQGLPHDMDRSGSIVAWFEQEYVAWRWAL